MVWRRSDPYADHLTLNDHLWPERMLEREVGNITRVIERVKISSTDAYEHPQYRLLHIEDTDVTRICIEDTLRETRARRQVIS